MIRSITPAVVAFVTVFLSASQSAFAEPLPSIVSEDGAISLPKENFRKDWEHLGSWVGLDEGDAHGIHDVYASKGTTEAFKATGVYPDGAILVKELRAYLSDDLTTGHVAYAGEPKVWFVMVKDSTMRFEVDNKHWADGWGWALFGADNPEKQISASYEETCAGCHAPAADTDFIYLQGYPTLTDK